MKVIFLDVDGVLNSEKFYRKRGEPNYKFEDEPPYPLSEFDPKAVELCNQITDKTGAKIVFSSTWRIGRALQEIKDLFLLVGITGEAIDRTGTYRETRVIGEPVRGYEIQEWLDNNPTDRYVIIDDDNDMLPEHQDNFIKTSFWKGLTEESVQKAIAILNI